MSTDLNCLEVEARPGLAFDDRTLRLGRSVKMTSLAASRAQIRWIEGHAVMPAYSRAWLVELIRALAGESADFTGGRLYRLPALLRKRAGAIDLGTAQRYTTNTKWRRPDRADGRSSTG